ncbi:unnamed protein product [Effrenium voratum]|uniref:Methyltransferase domain-containing protein n=1 Tax=Effrenium voratum TaxID=2562239 RepID=A0AA36J566_9DINO|nr:unnamed protein product [Effrenium voratum]CAJ1440015.1 unnamed protein product [Effrenium voratum]
MVYCCHSHSFCRVRDLRYRCGRDLAGGLARHWVQLSLDEATQAFLRWCARGPTTTEIFKTSLSRILRWCMSATDANALLGRGEMFALSRWQATQLLGRCEAAGSLLDVGAGVGLVTEQLAPLFDKVIATEASAPMARQLRRRGFSVLGSADLAGLEALAQREGIDGGFNCISLVNVLDRCDRPLSLLQDLKRRLKPDGRLLLAVVLPFKPFVEHGIFKLQPTERLSLDRSATWESAVEELWQLLQSLGFKLEALTRVPYLCKGDLTTRRETGKCGRPVRPDFSGLPTSISWTTPSSC